MSLDAIKARLGSISPTRRAELAPAVRVLLEEDLPKLIACVETLQTIAAQDPKDPFDKPTRLGCVCVLARASLSHLETP